MKRDSDALRLLKTVRYDLIRRQHLEELHATIHSSAYPGAITPRDVLVQESAPGDRMASAMADVDEIDRMLTNTLAAIRRRRVRVEGLIYQIDQVVHRQILEMYYCTALPSYEEAGIHRKPLRSVALLSLADVAHRLGRSHGYIRNAHQEAVRAFEEVYKKEGGR